MSPRVPDMKKWLTDIVSALQEHPHVKNLPATAALRDMLAEALMERRVAHPVRHRATYAAQPPAPAAYQQPTATCQAAPIFPTTPAEGHTPEIVIIQTKKTADWRDFLLTCALLILRHHFVVCALFKHFLF